MIRTQHPLKIGQKSPELLDRLSHRTRLPKEASQIVSSSQRVRMIRTQDPLTVGEQAPELLHRLSHGPPHQ